MTLCTDTETAIIESIDESIKEVFEMMAGAALSRFEGIDAASPADSKEISVVMGLTGELQGSLFLTMYQDAALAWTKALIDHEASEIDQTVIDGVGEMGNMVVGGAKRRLTDYVVTMSLPSVILAGKDDIVFPTGSEPLAIRYDYAGSTLSVLIALQDAS